MTSEIEKLTKYSNFPHRNPQTSALFLPLIYSGLREGKEEITTTLEAVTGLRQTNGWKLKTFQQRSSNQMLQTCTLTWVPQPQTYSEMWLIEDCRAMLYSMWISVFNCICAVQVLTSRWRCNSVLYHVVISCISPPVSHLMLKVGALCNISKCK